MVGHNYRSAQQQR